LAFDVGKLIAEILLPGQDCAGLRLIEALLTFEDEHVVELAAGLEDARAHADQKHRANAFGILVLPSAEVLCKPRVQSWRAIPYQSVEIVTDGMEGMFARVLVDGLVRRAPAEAAESKPLKMGLQGGDIGISHRPPYKVRLVAEQRA